MRVSVALHHRDVGTQSGQDEAHQLSVREHLLRYAAKAAHLGDQVLVRQRRQATPVLVCLGSRRPAGRDERARWRRRAVPAKLPSELERDQRPHAVTEERERRTAGRHERV